MAADSTYTCASGDAIYGGLARVFNDVTDFLWTPTKKADGRIYDGSWNALPLLAWCETDGTRLQQIADDLRINYAFDITDAALNFGTGKDISRTIRAWAGIAVDNTNGLVYPDCNGGHSDSSLGGTFKIDLERMGGGAGLGVLIPCPNPNDPTAPWSAEYKASGSGGSFTEWKPHVSDPLEVAYDGHDYIPKTDGSFSAPCARHQYGGTVFIPGKGSKGWIVSTRIAMYVTDVATKVRTRLRFKVGGAEITCDKAGQGQAFYDVGHDRLVGNFPRTNSPSINDDLGMLYFGDGYDMRERIGLDGDSAHVVGSPVKIPNQAWCMMDANTILAVSDRGSGAEWGLLHLDAEYPYRTQGAQVLTGGMKSDGDYPALAYVAEHQKAYRRLNDNDGSWRQIDFANPTAPVESAWDPAGRKPPLTKGSVTDNNWGRRMFVYTRHDGKKFLIFISACGDSYNCMYVMRLT